MEITDYTEHPQVIHPIEKLREYWESKNRKISEIVDEKGHEYVDLVMEGGGVLGIALVGYTYALESVGIRFRHVGGTSAGAINALMVASLDTPDKPKSSKVLKILADLEMFSFVDGDPDARDFVRAMIEGAGLIKMMLKGVQIVDTIFEDLGLNPGDTFRCWVEEHLNNAEIDSVEDLEFRMICPDLFLREDTELSKKLPEKACRGRLAIVAADISTGTKVVFPEMADLYWDQRGTLNPAWLVRASMSIPGFFQPMRVANIPQGEAAINKWKRKAGYRGVLPHEVLLVDGGIISNFPIDLFHSRHVPQAPTLGVKLGVDRNQPVEIRKPTQLLGAVFDAARQGADYSFLRRHPDYQHLVGFIETGDHHWLDFYMGPDSKVDLFVRGVKAAIDFLMKFDWDNYKDVRRQLLPQKTKESEARNSDRRDVA